ncbi:MAG TPA: sigma-70 family RNA polymerase sigma factor [Ferruginibacter sp.]|nr:sigma-70 family RNA polymerase sigma factor [Ferruginibacter sp.]HMP20927.1 sigma-70 family RNA polymerase sigma factor [Ferruginibacter sp.]
MNYTSEMPDEKLIQLYLNGNSAALSTLAELHKDRIYNTIYNMVQNETAAEQIFHHVFAAVINNLMAGKGPADGNFLQWAVGIARQLCLEYLRTERLRRLGIEVIPPVNTSGLSFAKDEKLPIHNGICHQSHAKIKHMIDKLPEAQREVIALNHYAGMSLKDIAGIMKCSLSAALDNMRSGLSNLWKLMQDNEMALR